MKQGQCAMGDARAIVQGAFAHRLADRIPRGELWLGADLFAQANLPDNLAGYLTLIDRLGHDCLCLPLATTSARHQTLGYRYFNAQELKEAMRIQGPFVMAIIDGPWQRLVDKKGLMACLTAWHRDQQEMRAAHAKEAAVAATLIRECLELSVDAVIIADDLAGESALFFDVDAIQAFFAPFYTQAISEIHDTGAYALFHSCGKIKQVIPHLIAWGFDGIAAIQHRANDLISIKKQYGTSLTVMAGIEVEMLAPGGMAGDGVEEYKRLVQSLRLGGGFILCSSTGLYAGDFLERMQELYRIADEITNR
jgi:hypothetical protein